MNNPLVSIIIPVYNREQLIGETLDSISAQTYKNWECILVDDGSGDNTEAIVYPYANNDIRIKFYHRPKTKKSGASSCRNYGLEKANGELFQFLDSDDLLAKNKLEEQLKFYKPGVLSLLTCKWGGFEQSSNLAQRFKYKYHSYRNFKKAKQLLNAFGKYNEFFPLHVYLTPRALIESSGNWNEELTNNDDAEFFTRIILNASRILFASKTSVYYRYSSADNLSDLNSSEKVKSAIKSWKLIESYIKEEGNNGNAEYYKTGKLNLYHSIKSTYPDMVAENQRFFDVKNYCSSPLKKDIFERERFMSILKAIKALIFKISPFKKN